MLRSQPGWKDESRDPDEMRKLEGGEESQSWKELDEENTEASSLTCEDELGNVHAAGSVTCVYKCCNTFLQSIKQTQMLEIVTWRSQAAAAPGPKDANPERSMKLEFI